MLNQQEIGWYNGFALVFSTNLFFQVNISFLEKPFQFLWPTKKHCVFFAVPQSIMNWASRAAYCEYQHPNKKCTFFFFLISVRTSLVTDAIQCVLRFVKSNKICLHQMEKSYDTVECDTLCVEVQGQLFHKKALFSCQTLFRCWCSSLRCDGCS